MSLDPKAEQNEAVESASQGADHLESSEKEQRGAPMPSDLEAVLREAEEYAEGEGGSETAPQPQSDEVMALKAQLEQLKSELAASQLKAEQAHEGALRARADLDNARRRFDREQKEATKYAAERTLKALFPVIDDLDLTISNISPEADAQLSEGVRLVHRKFIQALESQGVVSFYPEGESFDPTIHEALMEQPTADHEPGVIVQVFQRGWSLNERLLRAAKVIIAKAP